MNVRPFVKSLALVFILSPLFVFASTEVFPTIPTDITTPVDLRSFLDGSPNYWLAWYTYRGLFPDETDLVNSTICFEVSGNGYGLLAFAGNANPIPDGVYYTRLGQVADGQCGTATTTDIYFTWAITGGQVLGDTSTRIISITPVDGATVSTTTTVGIAGYVSPLDSLESPVVTIGLYSKNCGGFAGDVIQAVNGECAKMITYNATTSGYFSTTTTINFSPWGGVWNYTGKIKTSSYCILGYCFKNTEIAATSTTFTIGEPSMLDLFLASSTARIVQALHDEDIDSCNPLSGVFDILRCLAVMTVPDRDAFSIVLTDLHDEILTVVPFGYLTRFLAIITNNATTSLPSFTATFLTAANATTSITFDMQDMLAGGSALVSNIQDPESGNTFREILEPFIQLFVYLTLVIVIVKDLTIRHDTH